MDARAVFAPELFRDQVALVTGGGTGIGFQIARELGHLGAAVVIAARSRERLERATADLREEGIAARWQTVNIRKEDEVSALFDALAAQESLPDILVNNAGGQFMSAAIDISARGFRAVIDLNLNGTWYMSHAFARHAIARGAGGRIINIVLPVENGVPCYAHAAAARAGVINLTKTLAVEWARHGITVNSVAPGTIRTPGLDQYDPRRIERAISILPIKRIGEPLEVARCVAFFASPAGDYITGTTLLVDGGGHLARPLDDDQPGPGRDT